jgi:hypothetical protein
MDARSDGRRDINLSSRFVVIILRICRERGLYSGPVEFVNVCVAGAARPRVELKHHSRSTIRKAGLVDRSPACPGKQVCRSFGCFQVCDRGRRGTNPPSLIENDWWALGQHFGLATPLLDWTRSPFAALYFAFEELTTEPTNSRVVYALNQGAVLQKDDELAHGPSYEKGRLPIIEFIDPMSDENQRLVSQGGLFTRAPSVRQSSSG